MTSNDAEEFAGLPIVDFAPGMTLPTIPSAVAWRIACEYGTEQQFDELVELLLSSVDPADIRALVFGAWDYSSDPAPISLLVGLAPRLTDLRALFLAEIPYGESEISWIEQGDVTPLLTAYPELEVLRVRGTLDLVFTPVRHTALRELTVEAANLVGTTVRAVAESDLPALRHLELWLGADEYTSAASVDDLVSILAGHRLPELRHLGLRNAAIVDEVAAALATAPVVAQLDTVDLSMGTLTDKGAAALLAGQPLTHLRRLDLRHHYLGDESVARLIAALPGVEVNLSDRQQPDENGERYVAVSE